MAAALKPSSNVKTSSAKAAAAAAILPLKQRLICVDPELARLAVVLHHASAFRLWCIGREITRSGNGSGQIDRNALHKELLRRGVTLTRRHVNRLLEDGEGRFWNLDDERIFLRSWKHVAAEFVKEALALKVGSLDTNRPGIRQVTFDPAGTLQDFEAHIYAAWHVSRPRLMIARDTLVMLFRREKTTLRRWEKQRLKGQIKIRYNFVQCADPEASYDVLPSHHSEHIRKDMRRYPAKYWYRNKFYVEYRLRWQMSNTYMVLGVGEHPHKGQANKVRREVNYQRGNPASEERGGGLRRSWCDDRKLKSIARKQPDRLPILVWRGEDSLQCGIFEISINGYVATKANERILPKPLRKVVRKKERRERKAKREWGKQRAQTFWGGGT